MLSKVRLLRQHVHSRFLRLVAPGISREVGTMQVGLVAVDLSHRERSRRESDQGSPKQGQNENVAPPDSNVCLQACCSSLGEEEFCKVGSVAAKGECSLADDPTATRPETQVRQCGVSSTANVFRSQTYRRGSSARASTQSAKAPL